MLKKYNPIRPFSVRALGLLTLAVVLLASSSPAQTSDKGTYKFSSGGAGVTRGQSIHIHLIPKKKWFPARHITPGVYAGTVEVSLVNAEGRELARATKRVERCAITTFTVNVDEVM